MSKGLEALKELKDVYFYSKESENIDTIEKELKALEIIKYKQVNVSFLIHSDIVDIYNNRIDRCELYPFYKDGEDFKIRHLSKQEFNLLKEVLL